MINSRALKSFMVDLGAQVEKLQLYKWDVMKMKLCL